MQALHSTIASSAIHLKQRCGKSETTNLRITMQISDRIRRLNWERLNLTSTYLDHRWGGEGGWKEWCLPEVSYNLSFSIVHKKQVFLTCSTCSICNLRTYLRKFGGFAIPKEGPILKGNASPWATDQVNNVSP